MKDTILVVENLSVAFHTRRETLTAIEGVCLSIATGEILAVVGESGPESPSRALRSWGCLSLPLKSRVGELFSPVVKSRD